MLLATLVNGQEALYDAMTLRLLDTPICTTLAAALAKPLPTDPFPTPPAKIGAKSPARRVDKPPEADGDHAGLDLAVCGLGLASARGSAGVGTSPARVLNAGQSRNVRRSSSSGASLQPEEGGEEEGEEGEGDGDAAV